MDFDTFGFDIYLSFEINRKIVNLVIYNMFLNSLSKRSVSNDHSCVLESSLDFGSI